MAQPAPEIDSEHVLRSDESGVATLTLNRPAQYNALSEEMLTALHQAFDDIAKDKSVRVVVIAGNGKAFCAGHDLKQMRAQPDQSYYDALFKQCSEMMLTIINLPQPVIAKIHGIATAAGCQLVANCDLAIASTESRFAVSGVNLGLFCSTPSVALSRNVPRKRALEMLFTGDFIDSMTAERYNLINRAVAPEELDQTVNKLAEKIAKKPPVSINAGKKLFYQQIEQGMGDAYGNAGATMACNMMADETIEGIDAFIEKRPPRWD